MSIYIYNLLILITKAANSRTMSKALNPQRAARRLPFAAAGKPIYIFFHIEREIDR